MEHYRRARSTLRGCSVVKSFKGNKIFYLRQGIAAKWQELVANGGRKAANGRPNLVIGTSGQSAMAVASFTDTKKPRSFDSGFPRWCVRAGAFPRSGLQRQKESYSDSCSVFTCSSRAREYWRSDSRSAWSFLTKVSRRMISNLSFCTSMPAAGEAAAGRDGGAGAGAGRAAAAAGAAAAG